MSYLEFLFCKGGEEEGNRAKKESLWIDTKVHRCLKHGLLISFHSSSCRVARRDQDLIFLSPSFSVTRAKKIPFTFGDWITFSWIFFYAVIEKNWELWVNTRGLDAHLLHTFIDPSIIYALLFAQEFWLSFPVWQKVSVTFTYLDRLFLIFPKKNFLVFLK